MLVDDGIRRASSLDGSVFGRPMLIDTILALIAPVRVNMEFQLLGWSL
jgi:hypothetical protein